MKQASFIAKILLVLLGLAPAMADEPRLTVETVADGIYAFRPTEEALDTWRAVSNSGAMVLDGGVLIFDSHWTPATVEEAERLLRRHTDKPIRYVVNSHFHSDHTGGLPAYVDGVEIITHQATRENLVRYLAGLPEELPKDMAELEVQIPLTEDPIQRTRLENLLRYSRDLMTRLESHQPSPLPTLTFESKVVLHRGRTVEIYFLGRGHTDGDAVLFVPDAGVAFLGDLLWTRMVPNVSDGFTAEWIATLERVLDLGATRFVPGHGEVAGRQAVAEQIAYLQWLRETVGTAIEEGKTVEEAKTAIALPERFADYSFTFHLPSNIEKVFTELHLQGGP